MDGNIKVLMTPHLSHFRSEVSGIKTVVSKYFALLPEFGVELVDPEAESYDLAVVHAGMTGGDCDVAMLHGCYWTADYDAPAWEYEVNARIVQAVRNAKAVTVPSDWVAELFRRELRMNPFVIGHGVDWDEWQHNEPNEGYILAYGKNRNNTDVCNASFVTYLASRFPYLTFLCTFAPQNSPSNVEAIGTLPYNEFKKVVQRADLVMSPIKETWGVLTAESMAAGKPILGVKAGGNLDLVQSGVNGYLYEKDNLEDMAEGLNYCLKHKKILGENGREMSKPLTWESACQKVASVYQEAMKIDDRPLTINPALFRVNDDT